eukprot:scaffold10806_cov98-Isochrysis_galbana.AAC.2
MEQRPPWVRGQEGGVARPCSEPPAAVSQPLRKDRGLFSAGPCLCCSRARAARFAPSATQGRRWSVVRHAKWASRPSPGHRSRARGLGERARAWPWTTSSAPACGRAFRPSCSRSGGAGAVPVPVDANSKGSRHDPGHAALLGCC